MPEPRMELFALKGFFNAWPVLLDITVILKLWIFRPVDTNYKPSCSFTVTLCMYAAVITDAHFCFFNVIFVDLP